MKVTGRFLVPIDVEAGYLFLNTTTLFLLSEAPFPSLPGILLDIYFPHSTQVIQGLVETWDESVQMTLPGEGASTSGSKPLSDENF